MSNVLGRFFVRQRWRIAQTYLMLTPFIGILNTFLYALTAIGVNQFFEITPVILVSLIFGPILIINFIGWGLDKRGFFTQDFEKGFTSQSLNLYELQSLYNAMTIAFYEKFSKEELKEILDNHPITGLLSNKRNFNLE